MKIILSFQMQSSPDAASLGSSRCCNASSWALPLCYDLPVEATAWTSFVEHDR